MGCGTGIYSCAFAKLGCNVTAFDLSNNSIKLAKENAKSLKLNINFFQSDIFHLPKLDKYDLVFSGGVLHHTKNAKLAFEIISKFVKPKGRLIVGLYNKTSKKLKFARWIVRTFGKNKLEFSKNHLKLLNIIVFKNHYHAYMQMNDETIIDLYCHYHATYHSYSEVKRWYNHNGFTFKLIPYNTRRNFVLEKYNEIFRSLVLFYEGTYLEN